MDQPFISWMLLAHTSQMHACAVTKSNMYAVNSFHLKYKAYVLYQLFLGLQLFLPPVSELFTSSYVAHVPSFQKDVSPILRLSDLSTTSLLSKCILVFLYFWHGSIGRSLLFVIQYQSLFYRVDILSVSCISWPTLKVLHLRYLSSPLQCHWFQ